MKVAGDVLLVAMLVALLYQTCRRRRKRMFQVTVISGPMFSGKSKSLIQRIANVPAQHALVFKHVNDRRTGSTISSHDPLVNDSVAARPIGSLYQLLEFMTPEVRAVFIDEVQFMDPASTIKAIAMLREKYPGVHLTFAGLDLTFKGEAWEVMTFLLSQATERLELRATCICCQAPAAYSFRKGSGERRVEVGGAEMYEPRCGRCFQEGMKC